MDRVTAYANRVVCGDVLACKAHIEACQRHLDDLERQGTVEFPYVWSVEKSATIIDFMECLTLIEGDEQKVLKLLDWQMFVFGSWNGWVNEQGYRRFRTSYVQVPRQSGKSVVNGAGQLFYGNFSGYMFPQVYSIATKMDQAKIVLKESIKFIHADEDLQKEFKAKEYVSAIDCLRTGGQIRALGKDTKGIEGLRGYFTSVDEYHEHKTDDFYEAMVLSTKNLKESLVSVITTAGFNLNSPCFKHYEYCKHVLSGAVNDDTQFVLICEADKEDDPYEERTWEKANPTWNKQTAQSLRNYAKQAKELGGQKELHFLTKYLNVWVDYTDNSYIKASDWKNCGSSRELAEFLQAYPKAVCYAGLDLSSGGDLTSLALVFVYDVEGQRKYYVYSHSFIPSNRVLEHEKTDKAPYRMWIREKLLTTTETMSGIKTDYKYIIRHLQELIDLYELDIRMICYDPHNASAFLLDLSELGFPTVEIRQSARSLNDPTCDFALEVEAGNVEFAKSNELLTWSVVNAKVTYNSFKEKKIDKTAQVKRIDPVDAIIDAWKMAMSAEVMSLQQSTDRFLDLKGW